MVNESKRVLDGLSVQLKEAISPIATSLDIWSTKSMRESYLGGTAHYISPEFELKKCFLGLEEMKTAHTAEAIKDHATLLLSRVSWLHLGQL